MRRRLEAQRDGEGTREYIRVLRLLERHSPSAVRRAVDQGLRVGALDRLEGERDAAVQVETELHAALGAAEEFAEEDVVALIDILQIRLEADLREVDREVELALLGCERCRDARRPRADDHDVVARLRLRRSPRLGPAAVPAETPPHQIQNVVLHCRFLICPRPPAPHPILLAESHVAPTVCKTSGPRIDMQFVDLFSAIFDQTSAIWPNPLN